ncbi:NAD-dependent epimerase/dehydratase family protein [Frankia sp. R82]|uniref:NAD-dependent epimerase/dehydratase family protein n=1 Tax=Frankia sp. R82 TaxID=2950553 RepID=UPI0020436F65|nr:NAD-dependent epimerase/dehydratase family protein [Frankia sp. R82]MCM3883940.1 NAD-dependent epimerase/dehydratase [Frankia sp. R82]
MVRAVVTGAAGFLGGAITHALRQSGAEVTALDIRRAPGVTVADITRPGEWERALDGADLVVHAAAVGTGGVAELTPVRAGRAGGPVRVPAGEVRRVLLAGTANLLDAAGRSGVDRFVHLSCVNVVGAASAASPGTARSDRSGPAASGPAAGPGTLVDESAPVGLTGDVRADALAAAEQTVASAAAHGLGASVVRVGDAYGARAGRWTLWPVLLLRAGRFVLVSGGRGILSPVHVDDVVGAVAAVAAAPRDTVAGEVLQVTGGESVSAADFFGYYVDMLGLPAPRSVPVGVVGALDGWERLRALAEDRRVGSGSGSTAAGGGRSLVRGVGARLGAGVDPRARVDIGPLGVRELTRERGFSTARIRELIGWAPSVPLADGMSRTQDWLQERGLLGVREPSRRG